MSERNVADEALARIQANPVLMSFDAAVRIARGEEVSDEDRALAEAHANDPVPFDPDGEDYSLQQEDRLYALYGDEETMIQRAERVYEQRMGL